MDVDYDFYERIIKYDLNVILIYQLLHNRGPELIIVRSNALKQNMLALRYTRWGLRRAINEKYYRSVKTYGRSHCI